MTWLDSLDDRQQKEVEFARVYVQHYAHGTDGHNRLVLINRLAILLDSVTADLGLASQGRDGFQQIVRDAIDQIGDRAVPLPVGIATLKMLLAAADRVVMAARAVPDSAVKGSALRQTLDAYDTLRKERDDV